MKVVILAGGMGTRISEESHLRPKPLIEIGGKPILWHIMKIYSTHGLNDFVVCLGYKGYMVKEYFANYFLHMSDVRFDVANNRMEVLQKNDVEPWRVTLIDTGESTMTGGRLKRVRDHVKDGDFCFTYGDGVGNVDIGKLMAFHRAQKSLVTVTAVQPPGRYGALHVEGDRVARFDEKPTGEGGWVSGGFFVISPGAVDYIEGDDTRWEHEPLERLAAEGQLAVHRHTGFWQPMDTLRDKNQLEALWDAGKAPWKTWP